MKRGGYKVTEKWQLEKKMNKIERGEQIKKIICFDSYLIKICSNIEFEEKGLSDLQNK